jgi:hypothetical protein
MGQTKLTALFPMVLISVLSIPQELKTLLKN